MTLFSSIREKLFWDPENVNSNARQLIESSVVIMNSVESPLKNDLSGLPEMPPAVALDIRATLDHTIAQIMQQRAGVAQLGTRLKQQTNHVVEADQFVAELPRRYRLAEWARGVPYDGDFVAGFVGGTGDLAVGLGTLGGIGLENNYLTGPAYQAFLGHMGQPSHTETTVAGLKQAMRDKDGTLKALVRYDLLKKGDYGEWAGYMTPGAAFSVLTGGTGATTRVTTVTKLHKPNLPAPRPSRGQATKTAATTIGKHAATSTLDALTVGLTDIALAMRRLWSRLENRAEAQQRVAKAESQFAKAPDRLDAAQTELQSVRGTLAGDWPKFRRRETTPSGDHFVNNPAALNEWRDMMNARLKDAEATTQQAQLHLDGMPNRVRAAEGNLNRQQQLLAAQIGDEVIHHSIHGALKVHSFATALDEDDD